MGGAFRGGGRTLDINWNSVSHLKQPLHRYLDAEISLFLLLNSVETSIPFNAEITGSYFVFTDLRQLKQVNCRASWCNLSGNRRHQNFLAELHIGGYLFLQINKSAHKSQRSCNAE
jgi:hypothetical protein